MISVKKSDIINTLRLPKNISYFKPKSKKDEELPYIKLADIISKRLKRKPISASEICVSPWVCQKLDKYTKLWLLKVYPSIKRNTRRYDMNFAMIHLNYAPVEINEDWVENEYVYIRKI
jgi:hypothetical protein